MRLKEMRISKGLLQRDIAEVLSCSTPVYCRYEKGEREPPFDIINRLADFYGVTVDYLMGRDDTPPVQPKTEESPAAKAEDKFLEIYRQLNEENRRQVVQYLEFLRQQQ